MSKKWKHVLILNDPQITHSHTTPKAHVEEIIERIRTKPSVESYVICDAKPGGLVYRRAPGTAEERAAALAEALRPLAAKAQSVVRDLDPAVRTCERVQAGALCWKEWVD